MEKLTKQLLSQALDSGPAAVVVVSNRGTRPVIQFASQAVARLTGWDAAELIGRPLRELAMDATLPAALLASGDTVSLEQQWRCRTGGQRAVRLTAHALFQRPGVASHWALWCLDEERPVQAAASAAGRFVRQQRQDPASGVPDRRAFEELVRRDWALARRAGLALAMVLFRVDALASYRDLFGRHATDSMLRKVAHAISGSLRRDSDAAARYETDTFAALLGSAGEEQAGAIAARIEEKVHGLAIHHPRSPRDRYVTVSWSVASRVPAGDEAASRLLEAAERGLHGDAVADAEPQVTAPTRRQAG